MTPNHVKVIAGLRGRLHALFLMVLGLEATAALDTEDAAALADVIESAERDVDDLESLEGNNP